MNNIKKAPKTQQLKHPTTKKSDKEGGEKT